MMSDKTGIHMWRLQKKLKAFINADNGQKFVSSEFTVADFNWNVLSYPNGNRFENYGSVMLYLKLLRYPPELPNGGSVVVNFRMQCLETGSSSTFIETYDRVHDSKGWSARNLLLSDLTKESINKITFQVDVKILKIVNHNQRITYEAPLNLNKKKYNLRWSVPQEMVHRFEFANSGKWFESGNYSNLFCFKVAPNGYIEANEGACLLFLQLCALPPNISKMKCKVKLFHDESSTKWSIKKEFSYKNKNTGWTKNKLSFIKLLKHDTVTFRAEIEILGLYDLRGQKFSITTLSSNIYKYQAQITYDDSVIGSNTSIKSSVSKQKRSQTNAWNPYGGYGSHNYKQYFNDGWKQSAAPQDAEHKELKEIQTHETKDESSGDSEEDEHGGDYASDEQTSSESEIELNTMDEIEEQLVFLTKEYKKLIKIVRSLKQKSKANHKHIEDLRKQIEALKHGKMTHITPIVADKGMYDLLNILSNAPPMTPNTPQDQDQLQYLNVTKTVDAFDMLKKGGFDAWTTF